MERDVLSKAVCPVLGDISSENGVSSECQWGGGGGGGSERAGQTDSFLVRVRVSVCVFII